MQFGEQTKIKFVIFLVEIGKFDKIYHESIMQVIHRKAESVLVIEESIMKCIIYHAGDFGGRKIW